MVVPFELQIFISIMGSIVAVGATVSHLSDRDKEGWAWKCAMWAVMAVAFVWM